MQGSSKYRGVLTASGVYFLCEGLRMVAGFVSMPILTRALTKEEYGLLNLTFATAGILALVARMGFAEAITRFYYERGQQGRRQLGDFCSTMLGGALVSGTLIALATILVLQWVTPAENTARCLRLATLVVVIRTVAGVFSQMYRAQERPFAFSVTQLAARYSSLALVIGMLLAFRLSAYQVILATVVGEALVALLCLAESATRGLLGRPTLSRENFSAAVSYGMPLAVGLYATFLLDYGDRFLIERYIGLDAVATYSVPYDLVSTVAAAGFGSLKLALVPVIFRLWESEGRTAASHFVSQAFTYAVALALPVAVLFIATSDDLIVLLTSSKYAGSAALTPYLLPGVFLGEMNFLVASGLLLSHGTMTLGVLSVASCLVKVVLSVIFLPRWGLVGAASATTIAYALLMAATYARSRRVLDLRVKPVVLAEALVTTAIMVVSVVALGRVSTAPAANLLFRGGLGAGIAVLCMSILDREIRRQTWMRVPGFRPTLGPAA